MAQAAFYAMASCVYKTRAEVAHYFWIIFGRFVFLAKTASKMKNPARVKWYSHCILINLCHGLSGVVASAFGTAVFCMFTCNAVSSGNKMGRRGNSRSPQHTHFYRGLFSLKQYLLECTVNTTNTIQKIAQLKLNYLND